MRAPLLVIPVLAALLTSCGTLHSRNGPVAAKLPVAKTRPEPREADEDKGRMQEPEDQAGEAAEYFRFQRMPPGATEFPWDRYETARQKLDRGRRYSIAMGRELRREEVAMA